MKETKKKNIFIPCEIYTRVTGYYRPVSQYNKGKQEEFRLRHTLRIFEKNVMRK